MKRTVFLLMLVLVVGFMSCNRKPKNISNFDVVLINHGTLSFYDANTKQLTPYEKETDSVINMMFDNENHLYYTASKDRQLSLKMLDLNQEKPEPKVCADWKTTVDLAYDYMIDRVHELYFDNANENIYFHRFDTAMGYFRPLVYNIKSGKVREVSDEETYSLNYGSSNYDTDHYYTENHRFYYVTPEGKFCLNDKIDFGKYFAEEDEIDNIEFNPVSISPDGKLMVYTAAVYWGEGWGYYCVSNIDGSKQAVLNDSDIWDYTPKWLDNGSLVFIQRVPIPENDPEYDPDGWNMRRSIAIFNSEKNTCETISLGDAFAVRSKAMPETKAASQKDLEGCDVAIFDNGKVTFYNSATDEFIPYVADDDSIINGVFVYDFGFYYTVSINKELYLKELYLGEGVSPIMLTDWELSLDDCVSETYGKASPLVWIKAMDRVGINHNFSWDFYNFEEIRFYDLMEHVKLYGWPEDDNPEADDFEEMIKNHEDDFEYFSYMDHNYYYFDNDQEICISDKINFKDYAYDPEYFTEPEFEFLSIDPTRKFVAYAAYIEWGDLGHGPLCIASLDGKKQIALKGTDMADLTYGWLPNGSMLYIGTEARPADDPEYDAEWNNTKPCVMILKPNGTQEVFSHSADFVVKE